jgi:membrane-associated phospholipid phosphatase
MLMFDAEAFRAVNGLVGRGLALDALGIFIAKWLIWLMAAAPAVWVIQAYWRARQPKKMPLLRKVAAFFIRRDAGKGASEALFAAVTVYAAAAAAYLFNALVGLVWFRPRPFVSLRFVNQLIDVSPLNKSFPSDHAAVAFALACSMALVRPKWAWAALAAAAMVAFGRVLVGVHYPTDVLAGAVLGCLWAAFISLIRRRLRPGA